MLLKQLLPIAMVALCGPLLSCAPPATGKDFEQAKRFLSDIQELTFYLASWEGGDGIRFPDPETRHTSPGGSESVEWKTASFQEMRNRLVSFVCPQQDVRDAFSHGTYQVNPGVMWKGSFLGVAKMRDGSERILRVSHYGGFYTVAGINLLFEFDEIGRKKWEAIDEKYHQFLRGRI